MTFLVAWEFLEIKENTNFSQCFPRSLPIGWLEPEPEIARSITALKPAINLSPIALFHLLKKKKEMV